MTSSTFTEQTNPPSGHTKSEMGQQDAGQTTKLLLTVSGGLEDLAEEQVKSCFQNTLNLSWRKGPSGSQLYVTLLSDHIVSEVTNAVHKFDFIEYIFLQLECFPINTSKKITEKRDVSLLLQEVESSTSSISKSRLELCRAISEASIASRHHDAGMGGLPGVLLPTPETSQDLLPAPTEVCESFDVNTIYTRKEVAQSIVRAINDFLLKQMDLELDGNEILWLDAGSGNGAFLEYLPSKSSMGVDTNPKSDLVHCADFLSVDRELLVQNFPQYKQLVVISNPPFSLASRGDYTSIIRFVNHTFDSLDAEAMALICPSKFARQRIWEALGLTTNARLKGRFFLPDKAFYNPSNGNWVHIHSYCLIFEHKKRSGLEPSNSVDSSSHGIYLSSKRNKSNFPGLATLDLTKAIATGLDKAGVELVAERSARYFVQGKLLESSALELWWHVNPNQPCSIVNCSSIKVSKHSLGWLSLSCKPAVALAMSSAAMNKGDEKCRVAIDLMSGEGTVSLETSRAVSHSFCLLTGDKSFDNSLKTKERILHFQKNSNHPLLVDVVVWDANSLPIRRDVADAVFADLPFQGSLKKKHQTPALGGTHEEGKSAAVRSVSYSDILRHACRVLKPKGRAALLSPDFKTLRHAAGEYHWNPLWHSKSVNLGGLSGKLYLMERREGCTKDLSMWVNPTTSDLSNWLLPLAQDACSSEVSGALVSLSLKVNPVKHVALGSTYFHEKMRAYTHCYRIKFDNQIRNIQAKELEKTIRKAVELKLPEGLSLR